MIEELKIHDGTLLSNYYVVVFFVQYLLVHNVMISLDSCRVFQSAAVDPSAARGRHNA